MKSQDKVLLSIGTVAVLAVAGVVGTGLFIKSTPAANQPDMAQTAAASNKTATPTTPVTSLETTPSTAQSSPAVGMYKDGTYTAAVSYRVPHGNQNMLSATVTVKNGMITAAQTKDSYTDHESAEYIDMFEQSLTSEVVGKPLDGFSASRIGGASLTTAAFTNALATIQQHAKA